MSDTDWTRVEAGHYTAQWDDGTTTVVTKNGDEWEWVTYDAKGVQHGSGNAGTLADAKADAEAQPALVQPDEEPEPEPDRMHTGVAVGTLNLATTLGAPREPSPGLPGVGTVMSQPPRPMSADTIRRRNSR